MKVFTVTGGKDIEYDSTFTYLLCVHNDLWYKNGITDNIYIVDECGKCILYEKIYFVKFDFELLKSTKYFLFPICFAVKWVCISNAFDCYCMI